MTNEELISRCCPSLFMIATLRLDTPTVNLRETYRRDIAFFDANRDRRLLLREADRNEFDAVSSAGEWLSLPRLHVLVSQLQTGSHLVIPLYRGKAFFDAVTSDVQTVAIIEGMARRNGMNEAEIIRFLQTQEQAHLATKDVVH